MKNLRILVSKSQNMEIILVSWEQLIAAPAGDCPAWNKEYGAGCRIKEPHGTTHQLCVGQRML